MTANVQAAKGAFLAAALSEEAETHIGRGFRAVRDVASFVPWV